VLTALKKFLLGFVAVGLAVLLRWLLDPLLGDALPLVTLFGAVAAAAWVGGFRVAIPASLFGYAACHYLFIPPRGNFDLGRVDNQVGFVAYLFTCGLIITVAEIARVAQARATERREIFRITLRSIGDAVITTDINGGITYINEVAESLTGWSLQEALGEPLERVFHIVNEATRQPVENPATRALREGVVVGLANHTVLIKNRRQCRAHSRRARTRFGMRIDFSGCHGATSYRTCQSSPASHSALARGDRRIFKRCHHQ
jgi:PAS domain S-box-containing protein